MEKNKSIKKVLLLILNVAVRTIITIGLAFVALCVLAEMYGKHLCNDVATCYAIVVFLAGTAITTKIKVLDDKKNWRELILFIVGATINVLILLTIFTLHCFQKEDKVLLLLNFDIWINFIIVIRNLFLIIKNYIINYYNMSESLKDNETQLDDCKKLSMHLEKVVGVRNTEIPAPYNSLPLIIMDDIFSLRAKYVSVTRPTVERFIEYFLDGNRNVDDYSINNFLNDLDSSGLNNIAENIIKNKQLTGGYRKIDVCYNIAKQLNDLSIQTTDDFLNYKNKKLLETTIRSVKGVGVSATNYLFMLMGDFSRIKPDTHIHRCIKDAIGHDIDDNACQELFTKAATELVRKYPFVTPRLLDFLTWTFYSKSQTKNN